MEIEKIIDTSISPYGDAHDDYKEFHAALLKKYYNAAHVAIDYNRHRIKMDVIVNDEEFEAEKVNTVLSTMPMNLFYENLKTFLKSCLDIDIKSLAFYSRLIRFYSDKDVALLAV